MHLPSSCVRSRKSIGPAIGPAGGFGAMSGYAGGKEHRREGLVDPSLPRPPPHGVKLAIRAWPQVLSLVAALLPPLRETAPFSLVHFLRVIEGKSVQQSFWHF